MADRLPPPPPAFALGCHVRVVVNDRNRTPRTGSIRRHVWHHELACWTYFLLVDGRKIHKRHLEQDLTPLPDG